MSLNRPVVLNRRGSVAVTVALSLVLLVALLTFTLDIGYLFTTKNSLQDAVDAAALGAVTQLCAGTDPSEMEGQIIDAARSVLQANGISEADGTFIVEPGFYDEMDLYSDFELFRDYVSRDQMPDGEYVNAVLVTHTRSETGLTGVNPQVDMIIQAMAFLQRIDMAALDPLGYIRLGHEGGWQNTRFFSNGQIQYPESLSAMGVPYVRPTFSGCQLLAVNGVEVCPAVVDEHPWGLWYTLEIMWDEGTDQFGDHIRTGVNPLQSIHPVDDDYLDYWRQRADVVYTPEMAGTDTVYYARTNNHFYLDLAAGSDSPHRVIFFDGGEQSLMTVLISPFHRDGDSTSRSPNGYSISNLTLVATCSIEFLNYGITTTPSPGCISSLSIGGKGQDQAVFISGEDISLYPSRSCKLNIQGAVFRTGGDFIMEGGGGLFYLRAIADGSVYGEVNSTILQYSGDPGLYSLNNNSHFGPPCPSLLPRLGRLVRTQFEDNVSAEE